MFGLSREDKEVISTMAIILADNLEEHRKFINNQANIINKQEKEIKKLKETINLIERFLGDEYSKMKEEENKLLEKDE